MLSASSLKQTDQVIQSFFVGFFAFLVTFFIMAYLLMASYNHSIVQMNDNYKPINYDTALWFTLMIAVIGIYVKCNCGTAWSRFA
jgi:hypothetical protein